MDPISFTSRESNLFRFVSNSPTNATDATGLLTTVEYARIAGGFLTGLSIGISCNLGRGGDPDIRGNIVVGIFGAVVLGLSSLSPTHLAIRLAVASPVGSAIVCRFLGPNQN